MREVKASLDPLRVLTGEEPWQASLREPHNGDPNGEPPLDPILCNIRPAFAEHSWLREKGSPRVAKFKAAVCKKHIFKRKTPNMHGFLCCSWSPHYLLGPYEGSGKASSERTHLYAHMGARGVSYKGCAFLKKARRLAKEPLRDTRLPTRWANTC